MKSLAMTTYWKLCDWSSAMSTYSNYQFVEPNYNHKYNSDGQ